jgi:hypothetical protein
MLSSDVMHIDAFESQAAILMEPLEMTTDIGSRPDSGQHRAHVNARGCAVECLGRSIR